jgi:hypothetical protein
MSLEFDFLRAASALTRYRHELEPLVASTLGRTTYQYWILGDGRGDAKQADAGRPVALSFPRPRVRCPARHRWQACASRLCSRWNPCFHPGWRWFLRAGELRPWPVFEDLRTVLRQSVGYDYARCVQLCDALRAKGLIGYARPDLVALVRSHTRFVPGTGNIMDVSLPDLSPDEAALALCDTLIVTDEGQQALRRAGQQAVEADGRTSS